MAKELSAPSQIDQRAFGRVVESSDPIHYSLTASHEYKAKI
jgi:hypothetical protein